MNRRELRGRIRQARLATERAWRQHDASKRDRAQLVAAIGRMHALLARQQYRPVSSPVRALGFTIHFGAYDRFVYTFEEIFAGVPYAVAIPSERPLIFDCGANIGLSVLYFKRRFPQARVIAFEPEAANFELLGHNIVANNFAGDVMAHKVALGREERTAEIFTEPDVAGSVLGTLTAAETISRPQLTVAQPVKVERLSSHIDSPVNLLKLDIEGSEGEVLTELKESGKIDLVDRIVLEYHHHLIDSNLRLPQILTLLEDAGFDYQLATPDAVGVPLEGSFEDVLIYAYRLAPGV